MSKEVLKLIFGVVLLFIMMIPGVIMKKCKLSGEGFGKGLSNLVLFIASPTLIFHSYLADYDEGIMLTACQILLFSFISHTVYALVAFRLFKNAPDGIKRILRFAIIFSNAGYMGMPLIEITFGSAAVIYASAYNIGFNTFQWSLGVRIFESDGKLDIPRVARKVITNPCTIATILGLIFFITPLNSYVPALAVDALTMVKGLVAPLSMMVIGLRLAEIKPSELKSLFKNASVWLSLSMRHLILPLAIYGALRLLSLVLPIDDTALLVVATLTATPAATATTMFSERYGGDAVFASKIVSLSTILALLTMPLVMLLTQI